MAWLVLAALSLIGFAATFIPMRRVGGLIFWRIGRLGGSVYLSRAA